MAYLKLTIAWYFFFYKRFLDSQVLPEMNFIALYLTWSRTIAIGACVLCFLIGVLIEIVQGMWTENRTMDIWDVAANTSGIVIAAILLWAISRCYHALQRSKS